jgi:hypothetical protein
MNCHERHEYIQQRIDDGLKNCRPEYLEAAAAAALVLATLQPAFQASSITALVERVHPGLWPRADKPQTAAEQRNHRASVSGTVAEWFGEPALRKVLVCAVLRRGTHDRVREYLSNFYRQTAILLSQPYVDAFRALSAEHAARVARHRKDTV